MAIASRRASVANVEVVLRKLGPKPGRPVVGRLVRAPRRGAVLVVEAAGQSWQHRQDGVTGDAGHEPGDAAVQAKFDRYTGGDAAMAAWAHAVRHDDLQALAGLPDMTRD